MTADDPSATGRIGRWFRRLVIFALVLGAIAAVLPTILSRTPLRDWAITKATRDLPITVAVGNVSLGWWSPLVVEDLVVRDREGGEPIVKASRVTTDRTLWGLLFSGGKYGGVRVEKPEIDVVFGPETSNVETLLAKLTPTSDSDPGRGPGSAFAVAIDEGIVRIHDTVENRKWNMENLEANITVDPAAPQPLAGACTAAVVGESTNGTLDLRVNGQVKPSLKGQATAKLAGIPAGLASPFVRRGQPGLVVAGQLGGDATFDFEKVADGTFVTRVRGQVQGQELAASGGPLGTDQLRLKQLTSPVALIYNGLLLDLRKIDLVCDIGRLSGSARIALGRPMLATFAEPGTSMTLDLDLAQLASQLPRTLKLHNDVQVQFGKVNMTALSVAGPTGTTWQGNLTTSEIKGLRGGQPIAWKEPIALAFKVRNNDGFIPEIEELKCTSRFLRVTGSATTMQLRAQANADLGQLAVPLGQFVNLGDWPIRGRAEVQLGMKRNENEGISIDVAANLDQFQLGPWQETKLVVSAEAQTSERTRGVRLIDRGVIRMTSGAESLDATLRTPFNLAEKSGAAYIKLEGELGQWQHRLKPLTLFVGDFSTQGQAKGEAWIAFNPSKFEVQSIVFTAQNFKLNVAGYHIADPLVKLQASMVYLPNAEQIEFKDSQLNSQSLLLHTTKLKADLKTRIVGGKLMFRGDLARIQSWLGPTTPADAWGGAFFGEADLQSSTEGFDMGLDASIKGLAFGPPHAPRFSDPFVKIAGKGRFDSKQDLFTANVLRVEAAVGTCEAQGRLGQVATSLDLDVGGTLTYDLAAFEPLLRSYLGPTARVQGKEMRPFKVAGPLRPRGAQPGATVELAALTGETGFGWEGIRALGAEVGPAHFKAQLNKGWVTTTPVTTSLNEGKLTLTPQVRLAPAPLELRMPAGPVIEKARITPAMCASALGYALPMLANVTEAQGEFSLSLDGAVMPLADVTQSDIRGLLMLHHAKVGPGPLVQELASLLKTPAPYSFIRENQVRVHFVKGRVYHENLELVFPDQITIRTTGSVGIDGSLSMNAEVPIPQRLLGNVKLPATLAQRGVTVPIGGTIERPRLDSRAFQQILAQAARDAAGDLLLKGIEGGLKKFLQPKN